LNRASPSQLTIPRPNPAPHIPQILSHPLDPTICSNIFLSWRAQQWPGCDPALTLGTICPQR
jgi:hypothetical protein